MIFSSVCIINKKGRFLLTKQVDRGWEPPGGFLNPLETFEAAAVRETLEETGYTPFNLTLRGVFHRLTPPCVLSCFFVADHATRTNSGFSESIAISWVSTSGLDRITYKPSLFRVKSTLASHSCDNVIVASYRVEPFIVCDEHFLQ